MESLEHNGVPIHLDIFEFFDQYSDRLIMVNDPNDVQTGPHRLFPEETFEVDKYVEQGFVVATIWEGADTDVETVTIEYEKGYDHPFITGYFILEP